MRRIRERLTTLDAKNDLDSPTRQYWRWVTHYLHKSEVPQPIGCCVRGIPPYVLISRLRRVDSAEQFELENVIIATVDFMVVLKFQNCVESVYETAIGTLRAGYLEYYTIYHTKYKIGVYLYFLLAVNIHYIDSYTEIRSKASSTERRLRRVLPQ